MTARSAPAVLLVGAGRMGSALLKGWIAEARAPLMAVEPKPSPDLRKLARAHHVVLFNHIADVPPVAIRACVIALKPQVLATEARMLKPFAEMGALFVSIAAGTRIASLRSALGNRVRIVRAMPNTPGAIGHGISALFAPRGVTQKERRLAEELVGGLGKTVWVASEKQIDVVTAVSGSGPAYVFLLAEALAQAARAEGLKADVADALARATVSGAGALLDADPRAPADLRRDVTSPGGTTEAALSVLMANAGMSRLLRDAVAAARRRAEELGQSS